MNHVTTLTDQRSQKLLSAYVQMTGSCIRVFDHNCRHLSGVAGEAAVEENICKYCPVHLAQAAGKGSEPCLEMHTNAVKESNRSDGIHIYTCKMGLMFWTSPLFYEGSFLGALRGSGYLKGEPLLAAAETTEEFLQQLKVLPRGDGEKIKSMAEIMLICAASLSFGSEDYHEVLRRRTEQQRDISAKIEELKAKKINQPA
jgi:ligand-binding sensor protein